MDLETFLQFGLQTITLFVLFLGLLGLIVPVFPGLTVMWLATAVFAAIQLANGLMTGWDWFLFALITLLMIGGNIVDNLIIASKMRGHEIPWKNILLCYAAGIIVSLFFTPLIGLIASPVALLGLEYLRFRDWKQARESMKVFLVGWGASFAARFGIGFLMIVFWALWAWV
ncbi:MAG: DUF456 domain-containing protein [Chloroflexi bacterium]|nr:DUF456 domain-containing protein [Chloroflexota bacterium]